MEPTINRTSENRPRSFWGGMIFGCLTAAILGMCLIGGAISLLIRANSYAWTGTGRQSADPVTNGQSIFQGRCAACHSTSTEDKVGPGLAGLFDPGGPTLPNGVDYDGKLPNGEEITDASVAEWIREGGEGEIGHMPGQPMNDQQMEDLIAYLKTLQK